MATHGRKTNQEAQPASVDEDLLTGLSGFGQLRLLFADPTQERYEVARPLLLEQPLTTVERAQQTQKYPQTVRRYVRCFEEQGLRGLFDEEPKLVPRCGTISEAVRHVVLRLKTLYPPLHMREIANIIFATLGARVDYKTVQRILERHPLAAQQRSPLPKFHNYNTPIKPVWKSLNSSTAAGTFAVSVVFWASPASTSINCWKALNRSSSRE